MVNTVCGFFFFFYPQKRAIGARAPEQVVLEPWVNQNSREESLVLDFLQIEESRLAGCHHELSVGADVICKSGEEKFFFFFSVGRVDRAYWLATQ